ncbi:MAG: PAS domain-containing protein [Candidatus Omnitrophica bacterium]|nr:PAS domain-containing protein [Candidatus Omnitrophota bacterium]
MKLFEWVKQNKYLLSWLTIFPGLILAFFIIEKIVGGQSWESVPFHSALETIGAMSAILMAGTILQMAAYERIGRNYQFLGFGFLSMGVLDLCHASVPPGNVFVFFHTISVFLGAFCIVLTALPMLSKNAQGNRLFAAFLLIILGGIIFLGFVLPQSLPAMLAQGAFSSTAKMLNLAAGFLFLAAAAYFAIDFFKTKQQDRLFFVGLVFLFGLAEFIFENSYIWHSQWWAWHILRALAFVMAMVYVVNQFRRVALDLYTIKDKIAAEKKIREQNQFLTNMLEALAHPFYVINAHDYSLILQNSAAKAAGPAGAKTCYALTHLRQTPCSGEEHVCPLEEVKKTKKPVVVEHIHWGAGDKPINVEVRAYPILDDNGQVVQMIEYSVDITARKTAEKALAAANQDLDKKVKERTLELEQKAAELQRLNKFFVGRELTMAALKQENAALKASLEKSG